MPRLSSSVVLFLSLSAYFMADSEYFVDGDAGVIFFQNRLIIAAG